MSRKRASILPATLATAATLLALALGSRFLASLAQERPAAPRFEAVDIVIDSGATPLAAYQLELFERSGRAKLSGVEGGEPAAFKEAPYYDPAALSGGRIIVAAFSTAGELPSGRTRVARLHFQVDGEAPADYEARLVVAGDADGKEIDGVQIGISGRDGR
jgi:hypothetical protein